MTQTKDTKGGKGHRIVFCGNKAFEHGNLNDISTLRLKSGLQGLCRCPGGEEQYVFLFGSYVDCDLEIEEGRKI